MAGETGETIFQGWSTSATALPEQIGWVRNQTVELSTPHVSMQMGIRSSEEGINPRLYFKYIRTKLSIIEKTMFKRRMKQLEQMAEEYAKLGQEALGDECIRQFCIIARESAMWACGVKTFITREQLDKFRSRVKGDVKITPMKNFARIIPEDAARNIKFTMEKKLFDSYVVVHLDDKTNKSVKETDKEKVAREKDPICFGQIREDRDRFYFVCDWEDELCHLRLDDIIKKLALKKKDINLSRKVDKSKMEKWRAKAKERANADSKV
jgi:hypothetical protein